MSRGLAVPGTVDWKTLAEAEEEEVLEGPEGKNKCGVQLENLSDSSAGLVIFWNLRSDQLPQVSSPGWRP